MFQAQYRKSVHNFLKILTKKKGPITSRERNVGIKRGERLTTKTGKNKSLDKP